MTSTQKLLHAFQEAEALVASGNLKQAAVICRDMIDQHPDFAYGYYLMSSLFRATGTYSNALTFSEMAVKMQPENAAFQIQHGQILFSIGDNEQAGIAFRAAHKLAPADPIPLLLWADAAAQQNQFDEAVRLFARARVMGDIPEIDLHEGLCQMMKGAYDKAERLFNRVIERAPDYEWGHVQKGKLLMQRREFPHAEASFARALKCNPNAYEALHGMAMVSEQQNRYDLATNYAMQAIQSNPAGVESHMHLGSLLLIQHQYLMAEQVLSQAHGLQPDNAYITQMLLHSLLRQQKQQQAVALMDQALSAAPDNPVMQYFHAMLNGGTINTPPSSYISNLFNHYAERFDHHLVQVLGYDVPGMLAQMARELQSASGNAGKDSSLLDLGCGTGLVAEAFKDMAAQRVGVDLSHKMIDKARSRKLYNALYVQELVEFMGQCEQAFELVVAADVLIYVGELAPLFKAVRAVLAHDGLLLFSIEKEAMPASGQAGFRLKPTGRYTHSPAYIRQLAHDEGYEIIRAEDAVLRMENDCPVDGLIYALKKRQLH